MGGKRIHSSPAARELKPLKPLLKWAGGKRWLRPQVADMFAAHNNKRLVEPFCGALGITLGLRPRKALLNDVNPHAINFHRHTGDHRRFVRGEEASAIAHIFRC